MSGLRSFEENHVCWCLENKKGNISELIYKYNPIQSFKLAFLSSHSYFYLWQHIKLCVTAIHYWDTLWAQIVSYWSSFVSRICHVAWAFYAISKIFSIFFLIWHNVFPKGWHFYVHNFSYFQIKFTIFLSISLCWILKTQILKSGLANLEEIGLMSIKLFYVDIFLSFFFCLFPLHDII